MYISWKNYAISSGNQLSFTENVEFTFEANPGDLSSEKLKVLYESGVNRLSFGVQTFNNESLKKIGRTHEAKDVFHSVDAAKKIGFDNISLDFIYGLPGQTMDDFKETLDNCLFIGNDPFFRIFINC